MTSVLRQLQAEWNELVPQAQAQGVRRVRMLNAPLETIAYRREKLEWLRQQLGIGLGRQGQVYALTDLDAFTFGVEIECILPRGIGGHAGIARLITEAGVDCRADGYTHASTAHWKVVTDGSLGNYSEGCEVVSPVLQGEAGFDQLRKVCWVLTQARAKVNRRCGFHVHVGARSQSVDFFKNLVSFYRAAEVHIDSFMSPSRRADANGYCQSVHLSRASLNAALDVDGVVRACGQSTTAARSRTRYRKLNLQSYYQHKTVEFRQHQGTVEAHKAEHWVRFCLRMCLVAQARRVEAVGSFEELMIQVGCTDSERAYFQSRINHFAPRLAAAA